MFDPVLIESPVAKALGLPVYPSSSVGVPEVTVSAEIDEQRAADHERIRRNPIGERIDRSAGHWPNGRSIDLDYALRADAADKNLLVQRAIDHRPLAGLIAFQLDICVGRANLNRRRRDAVNHVRAVGRDQNRIGRRAGPALVDDGQYRSGRIG